MKKKIAYEIGAFLVVAGLAGGLFWYTKNNQKKPVVYGPMATKEEVAKYQERVKDKQKIKEQADQASDLATVEKISDPIQKSSVYVSISDRYKKQGDVEKQEIYLKKAYDTKDINLATKQQIALSLAGIYADKSDFKTALGFLTPLVVVNPPDSQKAFQKFLGAVIEAYQNNQKPDYQKLNERCIPDNRKTC